MLDSQGLPKTNRRANDIFKGARYCYRCGSPLEDNHKYIYCDFCRPIKYKQFKKSKQRKRESDKFLKELDENFRKSPRHYNL